MKAGNIIPAFSLSKCKERGKVLKKITAIFLLLLFCLCGCDFTQTSVDTLMKPPTFSKVQEEISAVMKADPEVKNVSLVYPKSGDYRSAYVIENIDQEPSQEALVFYREASTVTGTINAIKINVLDQIIDKDGKSRWVSRLISNEINANSIDKVSIVEEDNRYYIIIGFNLINADANGNSKELKVFSYEETTEQGFQLVNKTNVSCMGYQVYDMNADGKDEIIAIVSSVQGEAKTITANLYTHEQNQFVHKNRTTPLETSVTEYTGIYKGILENGERVLYLDGLSGKELGTEILGMQGDYIVNLVPDGERNLWELTNRPSEFNCIDLNQDHIYEIPKWLNTQSSDTQLDRISWSHYVDRSLITYLNTYTDYSLGYRLEIPQDWMDTVGTKRDSITNETTFFIYNPENWQDDSNKILKIKVQTSKDLPMGYHLLETNGELIYAYQIYGSREKSYQITESDLKRWFRHL